MRSVKLEVKKDVTCEDDDENTNTLVYHWRSSHEL